jgi:hypothetical protein
MSIGFSALTTISKNKKTGPIAVSSSSWSTCPPECGMKDECYAMKGYHTRLHGDAITRQDRGVPPEQFIKQVAALRPGTMFRHDVGGDLWHLRGQVDHTLLRNLTKAVQHLSHAWTYTHHKPNGFNHAALRHATANGFTVNISTENLDDAVKYYKRGYPVTCVVNQMPERFTHKGVTFVRCQNQCDGGQTQCIGCGNGEPMCAKADRSYVIAFEKH